MKKYLQKDISTRLALAAGALLVCVKLALTGLQLVLATPNGAPIDDTLMYEAARSITEGRWLGEYGWLTLSKYMFFPVWLAGLNFLHIPYLLGGQLLQLAASLAGVWAVAPVVKKRWGRLLTLGALLFNPAATAAAVQLRIYRDNITPALTLLLFAGFIGYALRYRRPLKESVWFLWIGGFGLAASYLNREDGVWLLPFVVVAGVVTVLFVLLQKGVTQRLAKCLCMMIPYGILAAGILCFCALNNQYYGRFILSDFTSKEFKDAYGAMTRVVQEAPQAKVPVPLEVRRKLYETVPEFAVLEPYLETEMNYNNFGSIPDREFNGGGFYWALRRAAADAGYYSDANTAKEYFESLAAAINAACDDGKLEAGPRRSGTTPPIKAEYVLPTLREGFVNLGRVLTFRQAEPAFWDTMSLELNGQPELRAEYEAFLRNGVNWQAQEGSAKPYYAPVRQIAYKLLTVVQYVFALVTPLGFAAALVWQWKGAAAIVRGIRTKQAPDCLLLWLIQLGLLLSVLLRCFIVAFMAVAAFNDVGDIMYLSSAHPILLLYAVLGTAMLAYTAKRAEAAIQ